MSSPSSRIERIHQNRRKGHSQQESCRQDQACHSGSYGKVLALYCFLNAADPPICRHNLSAQLDPHNAGVVIVDLTGRSGRDVGHPVLPDDKPSNTNHALFLQSGFVHDMARDASGDSEQCIIS